MANPARLLHALLQEWDTKGEAKTATSARGLNLGLHRHLDAAGYLREIKVLLDAMESFGEETGRFRRRYEHWARAVFAYPDGWRDRHPPFQEHDMDLLVDLAEKLNGFSSEPAQQPLELLRELFGPVVDWIPESGLPVDLKAHVLTVVNHCRHCVEQYEITGDFALRAAVDQLVFVLSHGVGTSMRSEPGGQEPGWWKKFKENFEYPWMGAVASGTGVQLFHDGLRALYG